MLNLVVDGEEVDRKPLGEGRPKRKLSCWGKEESDVDFTESDEEDDSDNSTVWGDAESWSGGDSSESSQVHEHLEGSTDEEGVSETSVPSAAES